MGPHLGNIMKKLIIAAALVAATSAHADSNIHTLMWLENNAGGNILLTDGHTHCSSPWSDLLSTTRTELVQTGCWRYEEPMVFVRWDSNNALRSYPVTSFNTTQYFRDNYGSK
jgi:hypothetical protein